MPIDALLEEIEKRPELFIGDDGIRGLRNYLCGYIMAMCQVDSIYQDWLFTDFTVFLAEKYRDNRSFDWATLIQIHEASGNEIEDFFRLIREYKLNSVK